jgi:uncharacterized protein YkwD
MLAKLAICAWTLYLGIDAKQALQVSGKALNARMVAFQKDIATNWAALRKAAQEEASNTVTTSTGVKIRMIGVEKSVLEATNAERAQFGLPALEPDPNLMQTAREHCAWMTNNEAFRHTHQPVAENIAMGQQSTEHVMQTWMGSSGHRANILNGAFRRIGVAAFQSSRGVIFWCQQFQHH